jgi:ribonuclease HI
MSQIGTIAPVTRALAHAPGRPDLERNSFSIFCDACIAPTNPGYGGAAFIVKRRSSVFFQSAYPLGYPVTNNEAEWHAFILAHQWLAPRKGYSGAVMYSDSQLVVNQMLGIWSANDKLAVLRDRALEVAGLCGPVSYQWLPREQNQEADRLSREALFRNENFPFVAVQVVRWPTGLDQVKRLGGRFSQDGSKCWFVPKARVAWMTPEEFRREGLKLVTSIGGNP